MFATTRDSVGDQADVDLITKNVNHTWGFAKGSASNRAVKAIGALLADRMGIPESERLAFRSRLPPGSESPKELTE